MRANEAIEKKVRCIVKMKIKTFIFQFLFLRTYVRSIPSYATDLVESYTNDIHTIINFV